MGKFWGFIFLILIVLIFAAEIRENMRQAREISIGEMYEGCTGIYGQDAIKVRGCVDRQREREIMIGTMR